MLVGVAVSFELAIQMPFLGRYTAVEHDAYGVLLAGAIICVVGVLDDKYDLPALVKLGGQVLAAGVAVLKACASTGFRCPTRSSRPTTH